jgi:type IV secretory pathway VirB2 component (pilin)
LQCYVLACKLESEPRRFVFTERLGSKEGRTLLDPFSNAGTQFLAILRGPFVVSLVTIGIVFAGIKWMRAERGQGGEWLAVIGGGAIALGAPVVVTWVHSLMGG